MKYLVGFLIFITFIATSLQASTMFLLTKIPQAYIVVENYSSKLSMSIKEDIFEEVKSTTDELGIDTSGFSHRTLAFIIYESYVGEALTLNIDLVLGEEMIRLDDKKEVYALTYEKRKQFPYGDKSKEEIAEQTLEYVEHLLYDFSEQYKEDNETPILDAGKDYKQFAKEHKYEIEYKKAVEKAKKENKQLMFVMVANFCPWCIKFEKKVLSDKNLNDQIHKKYVPLILNREEGAFPKKFDAPLIPTVFFVDPKDESIKIKSVGYHNRFKFINIINK
jgi:thioredoxin-related protein